MSLGLTITVCAISFLAGLVGGIIFTVVTDASIVRRLRRGRGRDYYDRFH